MRKLFSRKLWLAIAGISAGIAMTLGVESSEIGTVAGAVTTLLTTMTYIIVEGKVDTARANQGNDVIPHD